MLVSNFTSKSLFFGPRNPRRVDSRRRRSSGTGLAGVGQLRSVGALSRSAQLALLVLLSALPPLLSSGLARAQTPALSIQRFSPTPGPGRLLAEPTPEVLEHLGWGVGTTLNLAGEPLVYQSPSEGRVALVSSQLGQDLMAAVGLFGRLQLGVVLPFTVAIDGDSPPAGELPGLPDELASGLGDLRLSLKAALIRSAGPFSLSLLAEGSAPTGDEQSFLGDAGYGATGRLLAGLTLGRVELAANGGYRLRELDPLPGTELGDEIVYGGGGTVQLIEDFLGVSAEVAGASSTSEDGSNVLEGRFGARVFPLRNLALMAGGGFPILEGVGAPAWRVFAGAYFAMREFDKDEDSVPDAQDRCPTEKEDLDGYEDEDGCPDLDNDGDDVPDVNDSCPLEPEDKDNFQDEDGCPDEDNDGDGVSDLDDECANEPEDIDGWEDDDGCPELDNDGDKVPDDKDVCPFEAEDLDGVRDEDGCPDNDNDLDGVPDTADRCPNEPETYNAQADEDGCPDPKQGKSLLSLTEQRIVQQRPISFVPGQPDLQPKSVAVLEQLASLMRVHTGILKLRIEGHAGADEAADPEQRRVLGEARAMSVLAFLLDSGVEQYKLEAISGVQAVQTRTQGEAKAQADDKAQGEAKAQADDKAQGEAKAQADDKVQGDDKAQTEGASQPADDAAAAAPQPEPLLAPQPGETVVLHVVERLSR